MPHDGSPGAFLYNSSAYNLLSRALYKNTGLTPLEFADLHLFPYLGIENPAWVAAATSTQSTFIGNDFGLMLPLI